MCKTMLWIISISSGVTILVILVLIFYRLAIQNEGEIPKNGEKAGKGGRGGMGLEKLFPLILTMFFMFLILLVISGNISESTFATFAGVIIGVFITALKEMMDDILHKKQDKRMDDMLHKMDNMLHKKEDKST